MLINGPIAGLTLRQSLAKRRWIVVAALAALPVLMALITRIYAGDDEPITIVRQILSALSMTVVVPVIALVLANSGLGAEVDDGTIVYLLAKPISRVTIVVTKLLVAATICVVTAVVSALATGLVGLHELDAGRVILGAAAGCALGSFLYTSLFLALGLITRRGMLVGLVYLVVWEGAISQLFPGMRSLSVRQYMMAVADAVAKPDPAVTALTELPHSTAYQMSVFIAIASIALCIYRLRHFEVGQAG